MKTLLATAAVFVTLTAANAANAHANNCAFNPNTNVVDCSMPALLEELEEYRQEEKPAIATTCAQKWGIDYDMQLYCKTKQTAAMELFMNTLQRATLLGTNLNTVEASKIWWGIITECGNKWMSQWDFDMTNYCIQKQTVAYNQLQKR